MGFGKWLRRAAASAGRSVAAATHAVSSGIGSAAELAAKVPLAGPALHATLALAAAPLQATDALAHGARIDHVALNTLKSNIASVREIAPYAEMVVSQMPGVGSGVGAAFGMVEAISQGRPITEGVLAGIKKSLPGGPIAEAAFTVTTQAIQGKNVIGAVSDAALAQIPPQARDALSVVQTAARGGNIAKAALEKARGYLPPEAQKALDVGIAVGQGKKIQEVAAAQLKDLGTAQLGKLARVGEAGIAGSPVLAAGRSLVGQAGQSGYNLGIGLMAHQGVNEATIVSIRNKLSEAQKVGYDLALAARTGQVLARRPPTGLAPTAQAAYLQAKGLAGMPASRGKALVRHIAKNPVALQGLALAKKDLSFWGRVKQFLGIAA